MARGLDSCRLRGNRSAQPAKTPLRHYRNLSGGSGVAAYQIGPGAIAVRFTDGVTYVYTDRTAGAARIREMQRLAEAGQGLNGFISRVVKDRYVLKLQ